MRTPPLIRTLIFYCWNIFYQAEVLQELEQVCKILGSLADECNTLLSDFFPQLWDAIVNKLVSQ